MTFLELTDTDTADLALELWFNGDAPDLDAAAALAADLQAPLFNFAADWDFDTCCLAIEAGDAETIAAA